MRSSNRIVGKYADRDGLELLAIAPGPMDPETRERFIELLRPIEERSHGRITIDEIFKDHLKRECQCWAVLDGVEIVSVLVSRILVYPSGRRVLRFDFGGGRKADVHRFQPDMERLCRESNCDAMRLEGRKGWERELEEHGWHEVGRILEWEAR